MPASNATARLHPCAVGLQLFCLCCCRSSPVGLQWQRIAGMQPMRKPSAGVTTGTSTQVPNIRALGTRVLNIRALRTRVLNFRALRTRVKQCLAMPRPAATWTATTATAMAAACLRRRGLRCPRGWPPCGRWRPRTRRCARAPRARLNALNGRPPPDRRSGLGLRADRLLVAIESR
jgi:hypothetical protein